MTSPALITPCREGGRSGDEEAEQDGRGGEKEMKERYERWRRRKEDATEKSIRKSAFIRTQLPN